MTAISAITGSTAKPSIFDNDEVPPVLFPPVLLPPVFPPGVVENGIFEFGAQSPHYSFAV